LLESTELADMEQLDEKLAPLQKKLDRLTNGYLDQLIDETTFRSMQREIVAEKSAVRTEIERLQRTATSSWIEPVPFILRLQHLQPAISSLDLSSH
jgi:hypothetical protein